MITFSCIDVPMPDFDFSTMRGWIETVAGKYGKRVGELHYYFCSDESLLQINRQRLNHDFYTDIITFPLNECDEILSSEFCISIDRIADNAVALNKSFDVEFHRVMIHGVLHIIGFDDKTETDEKVMREKEDESLQILFK